MLRANDAVAALFGFIPHMISPRRRAIGAFLARDEILTRLALPA